MKDTVEKKSAPWTMDNLEKVLKSLKLKQSQDMRGHTNDLFHLKNIGNNLKESMLMIFNRIKDTSKIPSMWNQAYIKSIPKKKKAPMVLLSERGIFLVNKLRSILMKLISCAPGLWPGAQLYILGMSLTR